MIYEDEITEFTTLPQIAGVMPNDSNIEFIGVRDTQEVVWLQNGSSNYFKDLPEKYFLLLKEAYLNDSKAVLFLSALEKSLHRQVELYTYYMYGDADSKADILNGKLSQSENFRDKRDCPSLQWDSKNLNIGKHILTPRQILILDLIGEDMPDKAIADALGIKIKTLDSHKGKFLKAIGVQTKNALLKVAMQHKVIH